MDSKYKYLLVKFLEESRHGKVSVEIVPRMWVNFEESKTTTFFMEPEKDGFYLKEDIDLLHDFIKKELKAPESWPKYNVEIVGRARDYSEAEKKLEKLKFDRFAFTTDSETSPKSKVASITKAHKKITKIPSSESESSDEISENSEMEQMSKSKKSGLSDSQQNYSKNKTGSNSSYNNSEKYQKERMPESKKPGKLNGNKKNDEFAHLNKKVDNTLDEISKLKKMIGLVIESLDGLKSAFAEKSLYATNVHDLSQKYNIVIPINSIDDLRTFNDNLKENEDFKTDVGKIMNSKISDTSLRKNIISILKSFLTKTTASQLTATKKILDKLVLQTDFQEFFNCMYNALEVRKAGVPSLNRLNEKEFGKHLGISLSNSKDWDHGRKERMKKAA